VDGAERQTVRAARAEEEGETGASLGDAKRCLDRLRHELSAPLRRLFAELTGLPLQVVWQRLPAFPRLPSEPPCPQARRAAAHHGRWPEECEHCLERHWPTGIRAARREHRFVGPCGLETLWVMVRGPGLCPARLVIQASVEPAGPERVRVMKPGREPRARFERAAALLRFARRELELALETEALKHALQDDARRRRALEADDRRLRNRLQTRLPGLVAAAPLPVAGERSARLVERMADYVRHHYHRPLGLRQVADELGMNASYLSGVFSRATGMTFHQYLDEVRLQEACALLRDPQNRVSEVAERVGYASGDWFRHAFRQFTGLPPSAWRGREGASGRTGRNPKKPPLI
jgi:AraC-like DNA-binding protein